MRFWSLVENALVDRLPESELDSQLESENLSRLFEFNGLPYPEDRIASREQLESFLDRHAKENPKSIAGFFWAREKKKKG